MAKLNKILYLEIPAGKAQPSPPLGPMLGANWVNIGPFIKEFNDKTQDIMKQFAWTEMKVKCKLYVYVDRTFTIELGWLVTSCLILFHLKQQKWSWEPNKKKIWKLTRKDLESIAELKKWDMNTNKLESMISSIAGTARNMWVDVEVGAVKSKDER